jgi:ParB-like chromosome segregation protein Spo0J
MLTLSLNDIRISPTRQRREFDPVKLQELADSIEKHGLLQPLVVREVEGGWQLVCGERRFRAIRDYLLPLGGSVRHAGAMLDEGRVPTVPLGELDTLAAEEAELEENIRREDLTWQERAAATARLDALRKLQAADTGKSAPTTADISEEVRGSRDPWPAQQTFREIIVSKHLSNPEVAAAKTLDDAFKVLKRQEEAKKNSDLAVRIGASFSAKEHKIWNADALVWLQKCEKEVFDVILTDPPYGMGADEFGDSGGLAQGAHGYRDSVDDFTKILTVCSLEFDRIAKPQAHLYWFCDIDQFHAARDEFTAWGWWVHRTPLIWHKPGAMRVPWPEHGPQRKYELILYAVKGKRPTNFIAPDVIPCNPDDNLGHAAQKPVALFEELLRRSIRPGDTVCDPFCGTGPIFPAAHALKCRATGIERDATSYGIALKRLETLK